MSPFVVAALAFAFASALFLIVLIARRAILARRAAEAREAVVRLRPVALALIEGEGEPPQLGERDARLLAEILARYARTLEGESRTRVTRFFESNGRVERELRNLRRRRIWRRAAAAYALGDMDSPLAGDALVVTLGDENSEVRWAAARSLGRLGIVHAVGPIVAALAAKRIPHAIGGQALLDIGPPAVPRLHELVVEFSGLTDPASVRTRALAVELIGLLGSAGDSWLLASRLLDPSAQVREHAARGLGRIGARDAADALREALDDRIPSVRAAAATSLGVIRDRDSIQTLWKQAEHDEFEPAHAAALALTDIDPRGAREAAGLESAGPHLREAVDLLEAYG